MESLDGTYPVFAEWADNQQDIFNERFASNARQVDNLSMLDSNGSISNEVDPELDTLLPAVFLIPQNYHGNPGCVDFI